jgi:SAM-dependent methyltransferase
LVTDEQSHDLSHESELAAIEQRYARREVETAGRYESLNVDVIHHVGERQKAMAHMLRKHLTVPLRDARIVEVGCGDGANLLSLLRLGAQPQHLSGCDLLADRVVEARHRMPAAVSIIHGDASRIDVAPGTADVVMQFTVFSSILDDAVQVSVAQSMVQALKPGGAVLWYDFRWNNPSNHDVRGVPMRRVRELFGPGSIREQRRMSLAAPVARTVAKGGPRALSVASAIVPLRSHSMCWIIPHI